MRRHRYAAAAAATAVAAGLTAALPVSAAVAAPTPGWTAVADWAMDEPAGATTMVDSSGSELHGSLTCDPTVTAPRASCVRTGIEISPGNRGYRFPAPPRDESGKPIKNSDHLVLVPETDALDPGTGDYAVELRLLTRDAHPNIVQKGQSGTRGGFFKIEISPHPKTKVPRALCHFRDANGRTRAIGWTKPVGSTGRINDGTWHTIRCERIVSGGNPRVTISVDGAPPMVIKGLTGKIDNIKPLSIGGKAECNPPTVGCDYFAGVLDYVRVERPSPDGA